MKHIDTFSGIGGASLAVDAVWPDAEHVFVEIDPFCQAILKKHWPQSQIHDDIKTFDGTKYRGATILTGGFPCQPFSAAGKRRGTEDDRHLWPSMLRVIREARPDWVLGENVGGLITWSGGLVLEGIVADLEAEGYEVAPPLVIPAVAVNAPHRRDRVWIVAHAHSGADGGNARENESKSKSKRIQQRDSMGIARIASEVRDACADTDIIGRDDRFDHRQERHVPDDERTAAQSESEWQGRKRGTGKIGADASHAAKPRLEQGGKTGSATAPRSSRGRGSANDIGNAQDALGIGWGGRSDGDQKRNHGKIQATRSDTSRDRWEEHWLEAATRLCGVFNGLSEGLDKDMSDGVLLKYASTLNTITRQDLPHLWKGFQSAAFQWRVGRFDTVQEPEYLFTVLWKLKNRTNKQISVPFESEEVQNAYVRNVWDDKGTGRSSHRSEYQEQYAQEHQDALSSLSHEIALATSEIQKSFLKDRNARLKGLGNAWVPQVAIEILKAIKKIDDEKLTTRS